MHARTLYILLQYHDLKSMPYLLQANVGLFFSSTAFTLQNFTSSFFLNVTNVNGTGVPPAGAASSLS